MSSLMWRHIVHAMNDSPLVSSGYLVHLKARSVISAFLPPCLQWGKWWGRGNYTYTVKFISGQLFAYYWHPWINMIIHIIPNWHRIHSLLPVKEKQAMFTWSLFKQSHFPLFLVMLFQNNIIVILSLIMLLVGAAYRLLGYTIQIQSIVCYFVTLTDKTHVHSPALITVNTYIV